MLFPPRPDQRRQSLAAVHRYLLDWLRLLLDSDLITRTGCDAAGRRISAVDAQGSVTRFAFDNHDRLITVTENYLASGCTGAG